jgi:vacuolar-type H+-ATPase subunit E/Vma4
MDQTQQNSPDTLCAEILAEAAKQGDEIRRKAEAEASSLLATAALETEKIHRETLGRAQTWAEKRKRMILETVTVEKRRIRSSRVEALLEILRQDISGRLAALNGGGAETIVALAAEAIEKMPEDDLVLKLSTADREALGNGISEEILSRAQRPQLHLTISNDPTIKGGGVIVQDAGGSQIWDNRLESRLERLWPELRRQIAIASGLLDENKSQRNFA